MSARLSTRFSAASARSFASTATACASTAADRASFAAVASLSARVASSLAAVSALTAWLVGQTVLGARGWSWLALAVALGVFTFKVGRQRHMSATIKQGQHIFFALEPEHEQTIGAAGNHGVNITLELQAGPCGRRFTGADMGQHLLRRSNPFNQHLDFATTGLVTMQARRDDTRVVQHQYITGIQLRRKIPEFAVRQAAGAAGEEA